MFYSYGHFLKFKKFSNKIENINNRSIVGCIFLSFIGLFANFFIPLDQIFNTLLLIIGIIFLIFKKKSWKKKEIYGYAGSGGAHAQAKDRAHVFDCIPKVIAYS